MFRSTALIHTASKARIVEPRRLRRLVSDWQAHAAGRPFDAWMAAGDRLSAATRDRLDAALRESVWRCLDCRRSAPGSELAGIDAGSELACPHCGSAALRPSRGLPATGDETRTRQRVAGPGDDLLTGSASDSRHAVRIPPQLQLAPALPELPADAPSVANVGHWRVVDELEQGPVGPVYKAWHTHLGAYGTLRVLDISDAPEVVDRFWREVRAWARVDHGNVLRVRGAGRLNGRPCAVCDWVPGPTLAVLLAKHESGLDAGVAIGVAIQVADGLQALHEAGILHGRLTADHVLCSEQGRVRISGCGMVPVREMALRLAEPDCARATADTARGPTRREDLHALGRLLVHLLTASQDAAAAGSPARHLPTGLPESLVRLVAALCDGDPVRRPISSADVAAELHRVAARLHTDQGHGTPLPSPAMLAGAATATSTDAETDAPDPAGPIDVLEIPSRLSTRGWVHLGVMVETSALAGSRRFVLDFSHADHLDYSAVSVIRRMEGASPDGRPLAIVLAAVPEKVRIVMQMTGKLDGFDTVSDLGDAIRLLGDGPVRWHRADEGLPAPD